MNKYRHVGRFLSFNQKFNCKAQAKRLQQGLRGKSREVGRGRRGGGVMIHPDGAKALLTEAAVLVKFLGMTGQQLWYQRT